MRCQNPWAKFLRALPLLFLSAFVASSANAREDIGDYSIKDAMTTEKAKAKLDGSVRFYFGSQKHPGAAKRYGEFGSNKKTNAFNKSDTAACNHAFLSAMISLQNRAIREGGDAVINIKSNYKGRESSSNSTYKCGAGNVVAGVALLGTVVKLN